MVLPTEILGRELDQDTQAEIEAATCELEAELDKPSQRLPYPHLDANNDDDDADCPFTDIDCPPEDATAREASPLNARSTHVGQVTEKYAILYDISTFEEAERAFKAMSPGYTFARCTTKRRHQLATGSIVYAVYSCSRGGRQRKSVATERLSSTTKTNCSVKATLRDTPEGWAVKFMSIEHNHSPAMTNAERRATAPIRRHTQQSLGIDKIRDTIRLHMRDGCHTARRIARMIEDEFPGVLITQNDVYHHWQYIATAQRDGDTPTQT